MDESGYADIEIVVERVAQLFNSLDPAPFKERDLDQDAEDFIVGWARELPHRAALRLVVQLPATEAATPAAARLPAAVAHYFDDRAAASDRALKELFRSGWRYLLIGLAVLAASLAASQLVAAAAPASTLAHVVSESLLILGWVANWKPLETFLYDWIPIRRRRDLYRRLAAAPLVVVSAPQAPSGPA